MTASELNSLKSCESSVFANSVKLATMGGGVQMTRRAYGKAREVRGGEAKGVEEMRSIKQHTRTSSRLVVMRR